MLKEKRLPCLFQLFVEDTMTGNRAIRILFMLFVVSVFVGRGQACAETREEQVVATIQTVPEHITTGTPTTIFFSIRDRQGRPITDLTVMHDRLIHVVIASQDFSVFAHIHPQDFGPITPEMKKMARYQVKFTFPKAGSYIVGIDFAVSGRSVSKHFLVHVTGGPEMAHPKKDLTREKIFGGLDVRFSSKPEHITAGKKTVLTYRFTEKGRPVTDLQPYLAAPMHLAVISEDLTHFMHTHGELPGMPHMGHDEESMQMTVPEKFGPELEVHLVFPSKGLYQIFGQVRHKDKVILTSFMVEVD